MSTFALRLGARSIYWRDSTPSRVGDVIRATHFPSREEAEARAAGLALGPHWTVVPAPVSESPAQNPCVTLAYIRACVPDGAPIQEEALRACLPEIDRVLSEVRRAADRRADGQELGAAA